MKTLLLTLLLVAELGCAGAFLKLMDHAPDKMACAGGAILMGVAFLITGSYVITLVNDSVKNSD